MDKVIYVKKLEKPLDRNQKEYLKVSDQNNEDWNLFRYAVMPEVGKCYLFTYEKDDKGYKTVSKITPLVNVFKQEAVKELANKNDILREWGIVTSYAVQLAVADKIKPDDILIWAERIYEFIQTKAEEYYARTNTPSPQLEKD